MGRTPRTAGLTGEHSSLCEHGAPARSLRRHTSCCGVSSRGKGLPVKGRVLVVDDDIALAEMLGIVLRNEGLEVSHVADASGALAAFREARPDLVLLDVMLP